MLNNKNMECVSCCQVLLPWSGGCTRCHFIGESWYSLFQQVSTANPFSGKGQTSCPPPLLHAGVWSAKNVVWISASPNQSWSEPSVLNHRSAAPAQSPVLSLSSDPQGLESREKKKKWKPEETSEISVYNTREATVRGRDKVRCRKIKLLWTPGSLCIKSNVKCKQEMCLYTHPHTCIDTHTYIKIIS